MDNNIHLTIMARTTESEILFMLYRSIDLIFYSENIKELDLGISKLKHMKL